MKKVLLYITIVLCSKVSINAQIITTVAGGGASVTENVPATTAAIGYPAGGSFDGKGNYYFASTSKNKIFMVDTAGNIHTVAGNGSAGFSGDNGLATSAKLNYPISVAADAAGNLFISDYYNYRVRKVAIATHIITTIAGTGDTSSTGDGGPATSATLVPNGGLCVDAQSNVYVKDSATRIRKITPAGIISTIAGSNIAGCTGDGGQATNATLGITYGVCVDGIGNIYTECGNGRIRKIDKNTGIITTVAGNGNGAYIGDGMHADSAQFSPYGIAVDAKGQIYIADFEYDRVYQIDTNNIFHTVAGTGVEGFSGDGGLGDTAKVYNPAGVAVDACGNLYIADDANKRIRKVTFYPPCSQVDTTDTTTAINYIAAQSNISVYPNPAKEQLTVAGGAEKDVVILNVMGQVMVQRCEGYKAVVDVNGLKEGIYFIVVKDEKSGRVLRVKFLKE